eukprot:maker-scaffold154_size301342-snap-gene-0.15 protein:Tk07761 transcript:maker-scaffold154_size301342-snap-gene-0.15-mRNA-1 annotation:"isoform e"
MAEGTRDRNSSPADEVDGAAFSRHPLHVRRIKVNATQGERFLSNYVRTAKYTLLTFFPKFLYEQFRRLANVFFLSIGLLQQIPNVSPTGRYVTIVPFTVILALTAIKELIEDFQRHRDDARTNRRLVKVLDPCGQWEKKPCEQVQVGEVVQVVNGEYFPSDLVLLASSEPMGMCYVETSNLDGETNLKVRSALPLTAVYDTQATIAGLKGDIHCELPNKHLYDFRGNIRLADHDPWTPLNPNAILLRGAKLQNTPWIFGVVIYSGHETKLLMNSTKAPLKRSNIDRVTNKQIVVLFFILVGIALLSAASNLYLRTCELGHNVYWGEQLSDGFFYNVLTFFILYNNLIPISLQVTLEFVRFIQAFFIKWDEQMYHEPTDTHAQARTSNLNEELGQVHYVFSDKTGTLTQNVMEFKRASIAGRRYSIDDTCADESEVSELIQDLDAGDERSDIIRNFLTLMSICHTVIPEKDDNGKVIYNASSPDEKALVEGGRRYGFEFLGREPDRVYMKDPMGNEKSYELLNIMEFDSARKRMSVIVRTPDDRLMLFVKGADTMITERMGSESHCGKYFNDTMEHCVKFAEEGLRTLFLAEREISEDEYQEWNRRFQEASTRINGREEALKEVGELIEKDLVLLGATAIEDKLQDGVPEAIKTLIDANIKVWVLTGDKQETAINIGHSCNLLKPKTPLFILNDVHSVYRDIQDNLQSLRSQNASDTDHSPSLIIDGKTLGVALKEDTRQAFFDVCQSCSSVICCRVSPIQKGEVVELVREFTGAITLAIGDGANDVAMIQKANVGVGISGNEGLQAANSSDFSIGQFRFLVRLLLVHGSWNYTRVSKVILYSFYKNICLYVIELWYAIYNYWSGQVLFERWTIGMYNIFFTSWPPIVMGLLDQHCSDQIRLKHPQLYHATQSSEYFNIKIFWLWVGKSVLHSMILYWLPLWMYGEGTVWCSGNSGGYLVLGNIVYTMVVITVCLKCGLEMDSWPYLTHIAIWGSIGFWFLFLVAYSHFWPALPVAANMAGMAAILFKTPIFWACFVLVPLTTLLPDISYKILRFHFCSNPADEIRISEIRYPKDERSNGSKLSRLVSEAKDFGGMRKNSNIELGTSGYAFSQEEGGVVSQGEIVRRKSHAVTKNSTRVSGVNVNHPTNLEEAPEPISHNSIIKHNSNTGSTSVQFSSSESPPYSTSPSRVKTQFKELPEPQSPQRITKVQTNRSYASNLDELKPLRGAPNHNETLV